MLKQYLPTTAVILFVAIGCGKIPIFSPNRKNLAPWDSLPEGNGISYVEKFVDDPGRDPLYLAKIKYEDAAALQRVIAHFGLELDPTLEPPSSRAGNRKATPPWYPLINATHLYVYTDDWGGNYIGTLWVNENEKTMIIERSWQ
jgi:hypothetical protein